MLSVTYKPFMLSVIMLNVVILNVVAPQEVCAIKRFSLTFVLLCGLYLKKLQPS
jgi:hypothetical protein